jgi:hypothetical protein
MGEVTRVSRVVTKTSIASLMLIKRAFQRPTSEIVIIPQEKRIRPSPLKSPWAIKVNRIRIRIGFRPLKRYFREIPQVFTRRNRITRKKQYPEILLIKKRIMRKNKVISNFTLGSIRCRKEVPGTYWPRVTASARGTAQFLLNQPGGLF